MKLNEMIETLRKEHYEFITIQHSDGTVTLAIKNGGLLYFNEDGSLEGMTTPRK